MKYEITDIEMSWNGHILHRIRAMKYFILINGKEIHKGDLGGWVESEDNLSQEEKKSFRAVDRASSNAGAYGGLVYAYAVGAFSDSNANHGSRLAFKNRELAEYSGKQFIDIYKDSVA